MNKIIFSTLLVVSTLSAFAPASAQVTGSFNNNVNLQAVDTSRIQNILCQARPSKACNNIVGSQRTQPGTQQRGPGGAQRHPSRRG